jgi:hypothetical protein
MSTPATSWFKENKTSILFLIGQVIVFGIYIVRLESRVHTLEVRGSPHLEEINRRLTVTEKETKADHERIERIVTIMTKNLYIPPSELDHKKEK